MHPRATTMMVAADTSCRLGLRRRGSSLGGRGDVAAGAKPHRADRHPADRLGAVGAARRDSPGATGAHPDRGRRAAGADRRPLAERAGLARRVRLGRQPGRGAAGRDRHRHAAGVRLSGRRAGAVRDRAARDQLHPGVPGPAADPGDQRAFQAALSLGRAAEDRVRHRLGAAALARRHRAGRHVGRGQRVRRHGGGAAAGAAVSRHHEPRRTVRHHDGRHGGRGRHRAGALRHRPGADAAGCGGASDRGLRHQRAGGADAGGADGAGPRARLRPMRSRSRRSSSTTRRTPAWTRSRRARARASSCWST